jgi:glycine/betaine/sarcosine/D-proline reductase family selenoprotein B
MKKVVYYANQFFGGVGGESEADFEPVIKEGAVGPGLALEAALKGAQITHTIICGDNFMASHKDEAIGRIAEFLVGKEFDLFLAGPAFRAGRYGVSCGEICNWAHDTYNVQAVTSMHEENPGVDLFSESPIYILRGGASAAKMRQDIGAMATLANKIIAGEKVLWADAEGYFPRGIRKEVLADKIAADRTVDMLLAKLSGEPFETELKIEPRDDVVPSKPIADLGQAKIALISSGGLVPMGNPDRLPGSTCSIWKTYDISQMDSLKSGEFYSIHGGINTDFVNANPEVLVPLSSFRELEQEGKIGAIDQYFYSTTGNLSTLQDARRMGAEIGEELKARGVDGALLVST